MSDAISSGAAAPAAGASSASPNPSSNPAAQAQPGSPQTDAAKAGPEAAKAADAAQKAAIASMKKKYALKIDGRNEEVELDLSNDDEVVKHLQMSKAAQKRMAEVSEYKKSLNQFFEKLQADPLSVISDPRLKISDEARKKMAQAIINNELEDMQKTPEQKEKERLQKELEETKRQYEAEKKERADKEFQRMQEAAAVQYDKDISQAIESSGLPKTAYTVKQMAEALMFCLENKIDLAPQDIVPYLKKKTLSDFKEVLSSLPDDEFENWLGKDNISRVRKRNLAKIKAAATAVPSASSVKQTSDSVKNKTEETAKKVSFKEFMNTLGKF